MQKERFVKIFKNLAEYRSKNNFVTDHQNNDEERFF
jgi:hypothetical protein